MKVVGIGGSLRVDSQTYQALTIALNMVGELGVETELIDLRQMHLPFCNGEPDYPAYPDVAKLREKMRTAHAVIVATPEYHGSMSGILKNVFDLLDFEHVEGKVFLLMGVLGGELSTNAVNTLRTVCRHLHAWVLPDQIVIPQAHQAFNERGEIIDSALEKRLHKCIHHFLESAHKLAKN